MTLTETMDQLGADVDAFLEKHEAFGEQLLKVFEEIGALAGKYPEANKHVFGAIVQDRVFRKYGDRINGMSLGSLME